MPRLPEAWLRELFERTDLRQLVGSYVELKEKGGRLWGCCPFHHETEPSFTVNLQRGFYHCFGCGKHGNAVGFVMEMERLGFREACEYLADRIGLAMPALEDDAASEANRTLAERVRRANREAAVFFSHCLSGRDGTAGAQYLSARRVDAEIRKRFGLGFAPDAWHRLRDHLTSSGFSEAELKAGGLVQEKNGRIYDAFRNRVIFPIISPQGVVIGFGGRVLGEGVPKYLNSPSTPVFNKSRNLFNLNTARKLRQEGRLEELILMEGYMDVIGAARFGVLNTCATLGTALTSEQSRLLRRYVDRVSICYDGDRAGVKAAQRALGLLAEAGVQARVVFLPDGMDPDEYLQANGREAFDSQLEQAMEPMAFRFRIARESRNLSIPSERTAYAEDCVALLRAEKSALVRQQYAEQLQRETGYRLDAILADIAADRKPEPVRVQAKAEPASGTAGRAENFVAAVAAGRPDLTQALVRVLREDDFDDPVNAGVFGYVCSNADRGAEVSTAEILDALGSEQARRHMAWLLSALKRYENDPDGLQSMLTSSVARLRQRRTERRLAAVKADLGQTVDPEELDRKRREIEKLGRQLHAWKQQVHALGQHAGQIISNN